MILATLVTIAIGQSSDALWASTMRPYLQTPLWQERDAYDAGHYLMVPLHAAFRANDGAKIAEFEGFFGRMLAAPEGEFSANRLTYLQFLYPLSRYLVLAKASNRTSPSAAAGARKLYDTIHRYWRVDPAPQWGRVPFIGGAKDRLNGKLAVGITTPSYYRAIIDEELFLFGLAADLRRLEQLTGVTDIYSSDVNEVLNGAYRTFTQRGKFTTIGWTFDAGSWTDHPDYRHAGNPQLLPNLPEARVPGIATDSSHAHRYPLILKGLKESNPVGTTRYNLYARAQRELSRQFFGRVVIASSPGSGFPAPRTRNFLDGRNGVYRYNYNTVGENLGYGPFELSGTLSLGWWAFLESTQSKALYADFDQRWPLPANVIKTYVGPNTTREVNPLVHQPEAFENGFRQLLVRFAKGL